MSSPRSPKSGGGADDEDKQMRYRLDNLTHELELEKVKSEGLTDDNNRLKTQLADGEKRHEKINKVHAMIKDFQIQIQEATEENHRLHDELEETKAERDEGFHVRDEEIERLKALLAQAQGQGGPSAGDLEAAQAEADAAHAELDKLRAESEAMAAENKKLKDRLIAAKQELQKLQIQIDLPGLEGDSGPKSPQSKVIKALEERVKQLESSLATKNKYIMDELKRG